jgi:CDP-diacylglycerol--glycerol-3-phosphate 3-phosphatidyltransferase
VVFGVASVTDRVDGDLARRRGLVTEFGKLADPLADKALTGTALVGLSALGLLPWWVTLVILVREIGVTLLRFWVIRHGVIPASRGGKLKTLVQSVAIGLYLLPLSGVPASLAAWTMGLAVLLTVVTGVDYVVRALTLRQTSARARMRRAARIAATRAARAERAAGGTDRAESGRAESGRAESGRAESGRAESGRASPGPAAGASPASTDPDATGAAMEPPLRPAGSSDDRPVPRP